MRDIFKIIRYSKHLWPYYVTVSIFSILVALSNQVMPFITKAVADLVVKGLHGGRIDYAAGIWLALAFFGADIAGTLFSNFGGYYGDIMSEKLKKYLSVRYYEHLLGLSQSYYDNELTGKIINRLNRTIAELTNFAVTFSNNFLQMILTLVFTLVIVSYYSPVVAILLFAVYPLFLWLTGRTSRSWRDKQAEKNQHIDIASGRFAEAVGQIKVVKSFVQEKQELRHLTMHYQHNIDITTEQSRNWHKMDILRRMTLNAIFLLIVGYVFWQTLHGYFSIGEMFLLLQYATLMRFPLFSMSFIVDQTQRAIAGSKDYFSVMELAPAIVDKPDAKTLRVSKAKIEYSDISFSYVKGEPVLKGVSFTVKAGTRVALVGESGEGKTTITNLLLRLYEPTSGKITIDGQDITEITQKSLRENIAVVFQEPAPFSGTVFENIAYARPTATKKAVVAAAKAANAHEFIQKLPNGYDTQIGERGLKLSGGQKQRLAIARALLKDAPILILDEATSSLDSKAELQVQAALDTLMQGRTTLIVAHRLSTIAHVDTIVTLKKGKVDEIGTPAQLAHTGGIYANLLELQIGMSESAAKKLKEFGIVKE